MEDSVCLICGRCCLSVLVLDLMAWHSLNCRTPGIPLTSCAFVVGHVIFMEPFPKVTAEPQSYKITIIVTDDSDNVNDNSDDNIDDDK
jgi:hypothetical protein